MPFNTPEYGIFLVVVFVLFWMASEKRRVSHLTLLAGSYFFYASWNVKYLVLILFVTLLNFMMGLLLARENTQSRRKLWLVISLVGSLGILAVFKYTNFLASQLASVLRLVDVTVPIPHVDLLLPVGISFYVLQSLSYTIDLYRREIGASKSLHEFALFVSFFPQLVAGPIVRAKHFLPQLQTVKHPFNDRISSGLYQILKGMAKKVIIADYLGVHLVDGVFADPAGHGALTILLAMYGYAFQIYGDFSGYSDIAIGSARMLGFELPMNFDVPYRAQDLQDFWRRWHISLSTWLRDYLYIPLGGSRRGTLRTYVNLSITMLLGGLWHGAALTFVLWGAYHGALLALTRMIQRRYSGIQFNQGPVLRFLKTVLTFHLVCFGWIIFRCENLSGIGAMITTLMKSGGWDLVVSTDILLVLALAVATHVLPKQWDDGAEGLFTRLPAAAQGLILALALGLFNLFSSAENPFIYFQF
jgi:D-alanyl-lipoteichoic acid acyltransferase DltB (MBOAT superfamily)